MLCALLICVLLHRGQQQRPQALQDQQAPTAAKSSDASPAPQSGRHYHDWASSWFILQNWGFSIVAVSIPESKAQAAAADSAQAEPPPAPAPDTSGVGTAVAGRSSASGAGRLGAALRDTGSGRLHNVLRVCSIAAAWLRSACLP